MAIGIRRGSLGAPVHPSGRPHAVPTSSLIDVEHADLISDGHDLASVEVAYLSSAAASARLVQPSLASFLR